LPQFFGSSLRSVPAGQTGLPPPAPVVVLVLVLVVVVEEEEVVAVVDEEEVVVVPPVEVVVDPWAVEVLAADPPAPVPEPNADPQPAADREANDKPAMSHGGAARDMVVSRYWIQSSNHNSQARRGGRFSRVLRLAVTPKAAPPTTLSDRLPSTTHRRRPLIQTKLCRDLGMTLPIFAFSRSREVVVEVSKAGGMGVLGALSFTPEELDRHLAWIDEHVGGKPYGVDTVMPMAYEGKGDAAVDKAALEKRIPEKHRRFVEGLLERHHVGPLPPGYVRHEDLLGWSVERGLAHIDAALGHPIRLLANALGTPPPEAITRAHAAGVKVAALCGKREQALAHKAAGVDIIVAQGWEAGGHTGEIAGMVLCPEVVDAVGETPVLMAGGIGSGRQLVAALSLGAAGAWTGSIWLTTEEAQGDTPKGLTEKLLAAGSEGTVRSRAISGKPARQLRTAWTEAWDGPDSPGTLPMPLQWMVQGEAVERIFHHGVKELMGSPVGQIVGRMNEVRTVAEVMGAIEREANEVLARLGRATAA
jgi:NAD(P)H-dependent flavin oxidoreductase YrpB (nitropropane dioxygenase family)